MNRSRIHNSILHEFICCIQCRFNSSTFTHTHTRARRRIPQPVTQLCNLDRRCSQSGISWNENHTAKSMGNARSMRQEFMYIGTDNKCMCSTVTLPHTARYGTALHGYSRAKQKKQGSQFCIYEHILRPNAKHYHTYTQARMSRRTRGVPTFCIGVHRCTCIMGTY